MNMNLAIEITGRETPAEILKMTQTICRMNNCGLVMLIYDERTGVVHPSAAFIHPQSIGRSLLQAAETEIYDLVTAEAERLDTLAEEILDNWRKQNGNNDGRATEARRRLQNMSRRRPDVGVTNATVTPAAAQTTAGTATAGSSTAGTTTAGAAAGTTAVEDNWIFGSAEEARQILADSQSAKMAAERYLEHVAAEDFRNEQELDRPGKGDRARRDRKSPVM